MTHICTKYIYTFIFIWSIDVDVDVGLYMCTFAQDFPFSPGYFGELQVLHAWHVHLEHHHISEQDP